MYVYKPENWINPDYIHKIQNKGKWRNFPKKTKILEDSEEIAPPVNKQQKYRSIDDTWETE